MNNQTENSQTLDVYAKHADKYEQRENDDRKNNSDKMRKIDDAHRVFLFKSLQIVKKYGKLFEVGSGYGKDAKYIRSLGYDIQVSDAVDSFVERLKQEGFAPIKFNLITDNFTSKYDYILANAVLVHFTKDDVVKAIKKIYDTLNVDGIFAFTLKQRDGGGEDWQINFASEKRYFSYWDIGGIEKILENTGFEVVLLKQRGGMRDCWLDIVAKKAAERKPL